MRHETYESTRSNIPQGIDSLFCKKTIQDVLWAAFGPDEGNYFFAYEARDGKTFAISGPTLPSEFKEWLKDDPDGPISHDLRNIKVVLGPDQSFVSWSPDSIRWSNIPKGLEKTLQSWLTPAGWKSGPPRQIALGSDGAYFAVSEFGSWGYWLPNSWDLACSGFESLDKDRWSDVQVRIKIDSQW